MQPLQLLSYDLNCVTAPATGPRRGDGTGFVRFLLLLAALAIQYSGFCFLLKQIRRANYF